MRAGGSITIGWNGSGGKDLFDTLWKVLVECLRSRVPLDVGSF